MSKHLLLSRACRLGVAGLVVCGAAAAQSIDPVVVTATRTPVKVSDVVAETTVLDRDTLDRSEGRALVEVLAQAPGLQFSASGGLGKSASLFARGLEARHVLLLIDGVRVGSATLNTPSLDNLPLEVIDRIEIVRGPMTSLYGSNAMGGVVQVFTRKGKQDLVGNAKLSAGSRGYSLVSGGVSGGASDVEVSAQVQDQRTNGFSATNAQVPFGNFNPDEDGFKQRAGTLRASWVPAPGWRMDGLLLNSRGTTAYDDGPGADARAALRTDVRSVKLEGKVMPGWTTNIALSRSLDRYDTLVTASVFSSLGAIDTTQTQTTWENRVALPLGTLLAVVERTHQDVQRPEEPFEVSQRDIDALALGYSAHVGPHDVQTSLRRDRNSQFGGTTTGAFAYAFALDPQWRAGGSYGTSFTAPSFNQLYFPGFGNPNLQPEDGRHTELFAQWVGHQQRVRLTAYEHKYDLFISSGPAPTNVPQVKINGMTLVWEAQWDGVRTTASFDQVDPRNRSVGTGNVGKLLPRRAERAAKVSVDWKTGAYRLGAAAQIYSHRFDDTANRTRLSGYGVVDFYADWLFARDWALGLRLNNAGGKQYETALGYNQPGREGFVTLRWNPRTN